MSKYNTHFANEDKMLASKASRDLLEKRQHLLSEFSAWKNAILKQYQSEKAERIALRGKRSFLLSKIETPYPITSLNCEVKLTT